MDYNDHNAVLTALQKSQDADIDNRESAREAQHFLHTKDGQWDPSIINSWGKKPRYTFDYCQEAVDDITGEIEGADFGIKIRPQGGGSDEDVAEALMGLVRHIENASSAQDDVYNPSAVDAVEAGFNAWRVTQEYEDSDSFDQGLFIRAIENAIDNVWFDHNSRTRTHQKARHAFVLKPLSKDVYDEKWGNGKAFSDKAGSGMSVGQSRQEEVEDNKVEDVVIGEVLYFKPEKKTLVKFNDDRVYSEEKAAQMAAELAALGIVEEGRRTREVMSVKTRLFDGGGWLTKEQDTVFRDRLPVIPEYGVFRVVEDKIKWYGLVWRKMDAQRVLNMTKSRQVYEAALGGRRKAWVPKQALADEESRNDAATLNTNSKAVQTYDWEPGMPPPFEMGGVGVSPGLSELVGSMEINLLPNDARRPGESLGLRSEKAVMRDQEAEDVKNTKWFSGHKIAIQSTAQVLIKAIPLTYDSRRQIRILSEDGKTDTVTIHDKVQDDEGNIVEAYDFSRGSYDVVCDVGPQFKNRQQQTVEGIISMSQVDPTIIQQGGDVLLKNTNAPGMEIIANRRRQQMLENGMIPEDEMTDKEKEQMAARAAAAQGQQQPDPMLMAAEAELLKGQADVERTKLDGMKLQLEASKELRTLLIEAQKTQGQANQSNASAIKSVADAMKTYVDAGAISPEVAETLMALTQELGQDMLETDVTVQ